MLNLLGKQSSKLSIIQDTWKKECIVYVSLSYSKVLFEKHFEWNGYIRFKKGNTESRQNFKNEDFDTIIKEMNSFVNSL